MDGFQHPPLRAFQSAPGFSAGRNAQQPAKGCGMNRFQSAPGFSAGRNGRPAACPRVVCRFNPLPAFRPGETLTGHRRTNTAAGFNPLPAFRPGETGSSPSFEVSTCCFNPLPAFRPGETSRTVVLRSASAVSIRSRLFGREKPALDDRILAALEFQSAPGFSAGRNRRADSRNRRKAGFNPLPAFRPGETTDQLALLVALHVSIRSRLFGREKPTWRRRRGARLPRFNPLPAFRPGETGEVVCGVCSSTGFNPLPAFRPGETCARRPSSPTQSVSIRSRLFGREKPGDTQLRAWLGGVSIRSRLFGREKPPTKEDWRTYYGFQSAPGFSAGRNVYTGAAASGGLPFQSAPGFSAGRNDR